MAYYKDLPTRMPHLKQGPFQKPDTVYNAITEVGYHTVSYGLVDSYFGNVSYELDGILYISQTASSLDELAHQIDPCPLDGSSCAAITASSEFSAHKKIVLDNNYQAVLHGHPRFSVVMSLFCTHRNLCHNNNQCHTHCNKNRQIQDVPVIPGEVGCGPYGLVHTLPKAFKDSKSVIVYGHGVLLWVKLILSQHLNVWQELKKCVRMNTLDCLGMLENKFPNSGDTILINLIS
ncbi:MAG: hypothetical protein OMM_08047 [Candidatus Magnetoglobus multicellularis str. Araruama]|uniref:Class II aldolase/adducin N-terminal domain-containing protein n=1 Tax=Candidatus Magnetoglobus multicellularis str. Araruama TaxID=890399 RepID=A0A1V1P9V8_9BACT|nr:MAG: hypothetical protein OMM_08047 [Candidatus Magnetoglobus multicellularis str. Araruama]